MPDGNDLCVMCDQPAEPGSVSCRDCLEFSLASVGAPTADLTSAEHREVDALENRMLTDLVPVEAPVTHTFIPGTEGRPGLYVRTIFMPAHTTWNGHDVSPTLVTSKIHRTAHAYTVHSGVALVFIPGVGFERLEAGHRGVTEPFTRRVLVILEDCFWSTYHPLLPDETSEADLPKIEERIIEPHRPEVHQEYLRLLGEVKALAATEAA